MRLNMMLEPQEGMTYEEILAVARRAEAHGFEGLYRSDHYKSGAAARNPQDEDAPSTDAWATLAGLARDTRTLVLGTLVTPVTFRSAGQLAKVVATVAEMAGGGRVHVGLGTGWMRSEHEQFGFPFDDTATRFRRLGEHLQVLRGLWDGSVDTFTFDGEFEHLAGARFSAKPSPRPRILVGGKGMHKTPLLAAHYADELNVPLGSAQECRARRAALDDACAQVGRDPSEVTLSVMAGFVVGASAGEVEARLRRLHERYGRGRSWEEYTQQYEATGVVGTPERALERLAEYAAAGVERVMLQDLLFDDLEMLDVVAEQVVPQL